MWWKEGERTPIPSSGRTICSDDCDFIALALSIWNSTAMGKKGEIGMPSRSATIIAFCFWVTFRHPLPSFQSLQCYGTCQTAAPSRTPSRRGSKMRNIINNPSLRAFIPGASGVSTAAIWDSIFMIPSPFTPKWGEGRPAQRGTQFKLGLMQRLTPMAAAVEEGRTGQEVFN